LKEIIDQIVEIDAKAYQTEQKNRAALAGERKKLESSMEKYRIQVLKEAEKKADTIYNKITKAANEECRALQEKNKKLVCRIGKRYEEMESDVLKEVLAKLLEG